MYLFVPMSVDSSMMMENGLLPISSINSARKQGSITFKINLEHLVLCKSNDEKQLLVPLMVFRSSPRWSILLIAEWVAMNRANLRSLIFSIFDLIQIPKQIFQPL